MNTLTKTCKTCLKEKELKFFLICKSCELGVIAECRFCSRTKNKPYNLPPEGFKKCNDCKEILPKEVFSRNKRVEDGVDRCCKYCTNKRAIIRELKPKIVLDNKKCSKCKVSKSVSEFHRKRNTSDGYSTICKECRIPVTKKYNLENKDKVKIFNDKYKASHDLSKRAIEYHRKRKLVDPIYNFKANVRSLILLSIKSKNSGKTFVKTLKTEEILGCTIAEFKDKIVKNLSNWMSWSNRGKYNGSKLFGWDLDHIIPMYVAKTQEEVILLNHWSNFQPLCSQDNRYVKRHNIYPVCNLVLGITVNEYGEILKT